MTQTAFHILHRLNSYFYIFIPENVENLYFCQNSVYLSFFLLYLKIKNIYFFDLQKFLSFSIVFKTIGTIELSYWLFTYHLVENLTIDSSVKFLSQHIENWIFHTFFKISNSLCLIIVTSHFHLIEENPYKQWQKNLQKF